MKINILFTYLLLLTTWTLSYGQSEYFEPDEIRTYRSGLFSSTKINYDIYWGDGNNSGELRKPSP